MNVVEIRIVASGAQEAARVLASVAASGAQLGSITASGARDASRELSGLGDSVKRVVEIFTGVSLANIFTQGLVAMREFATEASKIAREAQTQQAAFIALSQSVGTAGTALAQELKRASGDTIDLTTAMKAASRGLIEGLQPQQLVSLIEPSRQLAKVMGTDVATAFNTVTEAIATGQTRMLRHAFITIDAAAATKTYADAQNLAVEQLTEAGRAQAIYLAFMERSRPVVQALAGVSNEQSESIQRLSAAWTDVEQVVGNALNAGLAGILPWLLSVVEELKKTGPQLEQFGVAFGKSAAAITSVLPSLQSVELFLARVGMGFGIFATAAVGPLTTLGAILDDIANKRMPRFSLAFKEGNAAQADALIRLNENGEALKKLEQQIAAGTTPAVTGMTAAVDLGTNKLGALGEQVRPLAVTFDALAKAMRALDEVGLASTMTDNEARVAALSRGLLEAIANTKGLAPAAVAAFTEYANNAALAAFQTESLKKIQQEDARVWLDLDAAIQKADATFQVAGDMQKTLEAKIAATQDALIKARVAFGASSDAALDFQQRLDALKASLLTLTDFRALGSLMPEDLVVGVVQGNDAWTAYVATMKEVDNTNAALGGGLDATNRLLGVQEQKLQLLLKAAHPNAQAVAEVTSEIEGLKAVRFDQVLAGIGVQAALLGPNFDAAGAAVNATLGRLNELADAAHGTITPEMRALAAQINDLIDTHRMQEALGLTRTTFDDLVDAARDTAQNMQSAVSDFFFTPFYNMLKTGNSAFDNFLGSMVRSLTNFLGSRITREFLSFITGGGGAANAAAGAAGLVINGVNYVPAEGTQPTTPAEALSGVGQGGAGFGMNIPMPSLFSLGPQTMDWADIGGTLLMAGDVQGAMSAFGEGLSALNVSVSTFGSVLAGVGAAMTVFNSVMNLVNGNTAQGVGGLTGAAGGAAAGFYVGTVVPGIGNVVGALIGAALGGMFGDFLGGLFGGGISNYQQKRNDALDQANAALLNVSGAYQSAATSGSSAQLLAALSQAQGPNGAVRTSFALPTSAAQQLGITGLAQGDQIRAEWAALTQEQFDGVLKFLKEQPTLVDLIQGSGDVPYLPQDQAQQIADQIAKAAQAAVTVFGSLATLKEQINGLAGKLGTAAEAILPPEAADQFISSIVDPIRDRMLAVTTSGLGGDAMKAQLDALQTELGTYVGLLALWGQLDQDMAALSGDLEVQTKGIVLGLQATLDAATSAVQDARSRFAEAISPAEQLAAAQQLEKAILDRYALERQLIAQVETAITDLLTKFGTPLVTLIDTLTSNALAIGDSGPLTTFLTLLEGIAATAPSAAERLFAVQAGIGAIAGGIGPAMTSGTSPEAMLTGIATAAAPLFDSLAEMIQTAQQGGDLQSALSLLQQQATLIGDLGEAAVKGVEQWRDTAVQAAQDAAQAAIAANNAQISALQTELSLAQQWVSVLQSAETFIQGLLLGPGSPLTAAQQLALVQGQYAATRAMAASSPEALGAFQSAAQALLGVVGTQSGQASTTYAATVAQVLKDMEAVVKGLGGSAGAKSTAQGLADAIANLQGMNEVIQSASTAQIQAIKDAAKGYIDSISIGLTTTLNMNAATELGALGSLVAAENGVEAAITGGLGPQGFLGQQAVLAVGQLGLIQTAIAGFAPPALAEGTDYVPRPMLARLHQGEMVVPARTASAMRNAPQGGGGGGLTVVVSPGAVVINGVQDPERAGRVAAKALVDEINRMARSGRRTIDSRAVFEVSP